jgi:prevent-host-death family protein
MTVDVLDSNRARAFWREVLDKAQAGSDTVIERYGKPAAVVIPYEDYEALQDELDDLRVARRASQALEAWKRDSTLGTPLSQVEEELRAEGLLE